MSSVRFIQTVEEDIRSRGLFSEGASILMAVSGGPDSVCLLHVMLALQKRWGLKLAVAHFDHALRGEESKRDAAFTASLAKGHGLPFYLGTGDVKVFARTNPMQTRLSVQSAARHLRYEFLLQTMRKIGFDCLATAHNAQDQAEELLFRFLRGSAMQGLCGIPWRRADGIIRPLLGRTREEILTYLHSFSLQYVEDSSNLTLKYERNRIRQELLPRLLKDYNPKLIQTLCRTAEMLREDEAVLNGIAGKVFDSCVTVASGKAVLQLGGLRDQPVSIRRRVYRTALARLTDDRVLAELVFRHLNALDVLAMGQAPNASLNLPLKIVARREYDVLHLVMEPDTCPRCAKKLKRDESGKTNGEEACAVAGPGVWRLPGASVSVGISLHKPSSAARLWTLLDYSPYDYMQGRNTAFAQRVLWLNGDRIVFPIYLRRRRRGDRFTPFGHVHSMKLKDFFIAKKIPLDLRDRLPVLVSAAGEIIAAAGVEIGEAFRVTATTRNVIRISLQIQESLSEGP
jgi:tRNA(Ile)-lysidine synthase